MEYPVVIVLYREHNDIYSRNCLMESYPAQFEYYTFLDEKDLVKSVSVALWHDISKQNYHFCIKNRSFASILYINKQSFEPDEYGDIYPQLKDIDEELLNKIIGRLKEKAIELDDTRNKRILKDKKEQEDKQYKEYLKLKEKFETK